jgi:methionyl-tRNA synthetase
MADFASIDSTYLSTTIPYVNAPPHVGFALELVQTDAVARYLRLRGQHVVTSTGSDDHSLKNVRAAEALGEPVRELVARQSHAFFELGRALGATFDEVVSTSRDPRHAPAVERLFRACEANGDLYRRRYRGTYCVGCELYYRPEELRDGLCPEHERAPEVVEEKNWFFRLSRYQDALYRAIETDRLRIVPEERKNEALAFVRSGLDDFSVSRSAERARGFGIGVPGDPSQVVYVWFDALANYLAAFDYGALGSECGWQRAGRRVHVLGKGVLRFHAVYWPALLLSAGLALPDELRVHGYLTVDGRKIGKSLGNGVDPHELVRSVSATALRHYLLKHVPSLKDADFSRARLVAAHDADLAGELGNLVRRVFVLAHRHAGGCVPSAAALGDDERELDASIAALPARLERAFAVHELSAAYASVWELVRAANRYVDRAAPWQLARDVETDAAAAERFRTVLNTTLATLAAIATASSPFVPEFAGALASALGLEIRAGALDQLTEFRRSLAGAPLAPPPLLAPRLEGSAGAGR